MNANIKMTVNNAAKISSASTQNGPFFLLIRLIGKGFKTSNILNKTIANKIEYGVWEIIGKDKISHIPITSSMTINEESSPYFFSVYRMEGIEINNAIQEIIKRNVFEIGNKRMSTAENEANVPGASGL